MRLISKIWKSIIFIGLSSLISLFLLDWFFPLPLPDDSSSRIVLAADGTPLWRFTNEKGVWRYPVTIKQVSPYYIDALLTYEDRHFYYHPGVNLIALGRAFVQDLYYHRIVSGGSTLSMQVARILDSSSHTYAGKIRQIFRAMQLEWHLNKEQILTLYLNHVSYGGMVEGIAAASWSYLGKPPDHLSRGEAALLAVLPQAPSRLRPDRYPERAKVARDKVLQRLEAFHIWPAETIKEIKEENVLLSERQTPQLAPLLSRRLYKQNKEAIIYSTIDLAMQSHLEELLKNWQNRLPPHNSAAILVVDTKTMQVKAYLGSVNLQDSQRFGYIDMVSSIRSPGSTLKPFLYGLALDEGLIHSASLLQDVPRIYSDYQPEDFSTSFIGPVSASQALKMSLNLPAVQLLEAYGPNKFYGKLVGSGINLVLPAGVNPNLAVILGGVGTSLENLVTGYSAFLRQGHVTQLRFKMDDPLIEHSLLSPGAAWIIQHILAGDQPSEAEPILQKEKFAWKTGTSYGYRDAWAIGFGARYLIGVWIGRPDGTPVAGQYGMASAAPLLFQVHDMIRNQEYRKMMGLENDSRPASVSIAIICWPSGQELPSKDSNCRQKHKAWVLGGIIPPTLELPNQSLGNGINQIIWLNNQGLQVAPDCPKAIEQKVDFWPISLESWLPLTEQRIYRLPAVDQKCPPLKSKQSSFLSIIGVKNGDYLRLPISNTNLLTLKLSSLGGSQKQWWFLNGNVIQETVNNHAFNYTFHVLGKQQLVVMDETGKTAMVEFSID